MKECHRCLQYVRKHFIVKIPTGDCADLHEEYVPYDDSYDARNDTNRIDVHGAIGG